MSLLPPPPPTPPSSATTATASSATAIGPNDCPLRDQRERGGSAGKKKPLHTNSNNKLVRALCASNAVDVRRYWHLWNGRGRFHFPSSYYCCMLSPLSSSIVAATPLNNNTTNSSGAASSFSSSSKKEDDDEEAATMEPASKKSRRAMGAIAHGRPLPPPASALHTSPPMQQQQLVSLGGSLLTPVQFALRYYLFLLHAARMRTQLLSSQQEHEQASGSTTTTTVTLTMVQCSVDEIVALATPMMTAVAAANDNDDEQRERAQLMHSARTTLEAVLQLSDPMDQRFAVNDICFGFAVLSGNQQRAVLPSELDVIQLLALLPWPADTRLPANEGDARWVETFQTVLRRRRMQVAEWILRHRIAPSLVPLLAARKLFDAASYFTVDDFDHAVPFLLRFDPDLHLRDRRPHMRRNGAHTALHIMFYSIMEMRAPEDKLARLLDAGADPWALDGVGRTPLDFVREQLGHHLEHRARRQRERSRRNRTFFEESDARAEALRRGQIALLEAAMARRGDPPSRRLALAMALHPRLGANAPIACLGTDELALVMRLALAHLEPDYPIAYHHLTEEEEEAPPRDNNDGASASASASASAAAAAAPSSSP